MRQRLPLTCLCALFLATLAPVTLSAQEVPTGLPEVSFEEELPERPPAEAASPAAAVSPGLTYLAPSGYSGLLRIVEARSGQRGTFGLALFGEYASARDFTIVGDSVERLVGSVLLGWTPLAWLDASLRFGARSVTNDLASPVLIQSVGDLSLGARATWGLGDDWSIGALVDLTLLAGADAIGLDGGGARSDLFFLLTWQGLRGGRLPVSFHMNTGFIFDSSASLFERPLGPASRFGHGVYDYDRYRVALGAELTYERWAAFLEWVTDAPLSAPCRNDSPQPCLADVGGAGWPAFLSLGGRYAPIAPLSLMTAFEFGLTTEESQGTPGVPAFNWVFGLAWHLDPTPPAAPPTDEPEVEVVYLEPEQIPMGWLAGRVLDATDQQPIDGARLLFSDRPWSGIATDENGAFRTPDFPVGTRFELRIVHPAYNERVLQAVIGEGERQGDLLIQPAIDGARLTGVVALDGAEPTQAVVSVRGDVDADVVPDARGRFRLDVPAGRYLLTVSAPGHRAARGAIVLEAGAQARNITLERLASPDLPRWEAERIVFDGDEQRILFEQETLTESSLVALRHIARLLQDTRGARILVRAHTDDRGDVEGELALAEARGLMVVEALVGMQVGPERLEVEAVGSLEPLFPNVSERNRRRNNRVEFVLLFAP